jgi:hypothetical protein
MAREKPQKGLGSKFFRNLFRSCQSEHLKEIYQAPFRVTYPFIRVGRVLSSPIAVLKSGRGKTNLLVDKGYLSEQITKQELPPC